MTDIRDPVATATKAVELVRERQREIIRLKLRHRRELKAAVAARNQALARASSRHVPADELAETSGLSLSYVERLLRRMSPRG